MIVTGSGSGIGRATAIAFARETRTFQNDRTEDLIDLGTASVETKGDTKIEQVVGGGCLQFLSGIAQD